MMFQESPPPPFSLFIQPISMLHFLSPPLLCSSFHFCPSVPPFLCQVVILYNRNKHYWNVLSVAVSIVYEFIHCENGRLVMTYRVLLKNLLCISKVWLLWPCYILRLSLLFQDSDSWLPLWQKCVCFNYAPSQVLSKPSLPDEDFFYY